MRRRAAEASVAAVARAWAEAGELQEPLGGEWGPLPDGDRDLGRAQAFDQLALVPGRIGVDLDLAVGDQPLDVRGSQVRLVVVARDDEVHAIRSPRWPRPR